MKALITAGGRATRLRPITSTINKHLIPLANKPMIMHAIEKVTEAGITEIGIIVNVGEVELQKAVGDGSRWGAAVTYIEQKGGPLGIAHAVNAARPFLGDEPFIFYLGDNIILGSLSRFVEKFREKHLSCLLMLAKVRDARQFGVAEFRDGRIVSVEEKPVEPKSDLAVTGIYLYDKSFFEAFKHIVPSTRNEYEISDVHSWLIANGYAVGHEEITGWWKDTGRPKDLLEGNMLLLAERDTRHIRIDGDVHPDASVSGAVDIGNGTVIGKNVVIRGPVAIGADCVIRDAYVGPYTSIGNRVRIDGAEVEHSVIFDDVTIVCGERIVDSILGKGAAVTSVRATLPHGHRLVVGDHSAVEL